ncbi:hypothetical protein MNBD_GAMMA25-341 [hydrothermal vent metagenome]|uniref:Uncharacterized protein n=1 Tax=hydrothermal vent metagenome TaxID=652676 RepID=A0A3B1BIY8_9ZZZZ
MEFFATLKLVATEEELQQQLKVETVTHFCASIYEVMSYEKDTAEVSMVWGRFNVLRECIRGGVRFTLPNCLNGVAWTITISPDDRVQEVMVHCTINRKEQDTDFVESLEDFVADWAVGLEQHFPLKIDVNESHRAKHA